MTPPDPPSEQLTPEPPGTEPMTADEIIAMAAAGPRLHRDHLLRMAAEMARHGAQWTGAEEIRILMAYGDLVTLAVNEAVGEMSASFSRKVTLDIIDSRCNADVSGWFRRHRPR